MKFVAYSIVFLGLFIAHAGVHAGVTISGTGKTPEEACWEHDYKGNEHARDKTTCFTRCQPSMPIFDGTNYYHASKAPKHKGSCKASKYDAGYQGQKEWLAANPKPGSPPPLPPVVKPGVAAPKTGINLVQFQAGVPNSERARLSIVNNSNERGITAYQVSVRDGRYSFPARVIEEGTVVLEPKTSWNKEFHQWGAEKWTYKAQ